MGALVPAFTHEGDSFAIALHVHLERDARRLFPLPSSLRETEMHRTDESVRKTKVGEIFAIEHDEEFLHLERTEAWRRVGDLRDRGAR